MFHEITSHPIAEIGSLAHIEHVSLLIFEQIHSRICGNSF